MKGVVFVEFLEMVEAKFSPEMLEEIIEEAQLPNGGAYTSVGTYDHREIYRLVTALSGAAQLPIAQLLRDFGAHLFPRLVASHQEIVRSKTTSALDFLLGIERHVHAEVRKLYPDAELPSIGARMHGPRKLIVEYSSTRALADLAHGLLFGCVAYFGEAITIERRDLDGEANAHTLFVLTRADGWIR